MLIGYHCKNQFGHHDEKDLICLIHRKWNYQLRAWPIYLSVIPLFFFGKIRFDSVWSTKLTKIIQTFHTSFQCHFTKTMAVCNIKKTCPQLMRTLLVSLVDKLRFSSTTGSTGTFSVVFGLLILLTAWSTISLLFFSHTIRFCHSIIWLHISIKILHYASILFVSKQEFIWSQSLE